MRTLICGSMAYDTIMVFPDHFKKHILPEQLHILNVAFLVPTMRREYGGCAGNIAYNLKLLGGEPVMMATIGDDFAEGKITLPIILAFRRGDEEERAFWRRTLEELDQGEDGADLAHAIKLMDKHGSLKATVDRARHYGNIARDALGLFPDGEIKQALLDVVDFCIERAH